MDDEDEEGEQEYAPGSNDDTPNAHELSSDAFIEDEHFVVRKVSSTKKHESNEEDEKSEQSQPAQISSSHSQEIKARTHSPKKTSPGKLSKSLKKKQK